MSATPENNAAPPCGLIRRLAAIVYDGMLIVGLWMLATLLVLPLSRGQAVGTANVWYQLYLFAIAWWYCAWCWRRGGQTLGMRAWRIFLVAPETPVSWPRTLARFATAWLSALVGGIGFWWSLFHPRRATWHDLLSNTRLVVKPRPGDANIKNAV